MRPQVSGWPACREGCLWLGLVGRLLGQTSQTCYCISATLAVLQQPLGQLVQVGRQRRQRRPALGFRTGFLR